MSDFRLEDLWAIIQGLFIVAVLLFGGMALIALWPKIGQVARATWHRYVLFSWDELMECFADQDEDVNRFDGDWGTAPPTGIMATVPITPTHTSTILVYTSDDLIRVAARLTYAERIAVLASMRDEDKKPYSANKIVAYMGGDRNSVLAVVRGLRIEEDEPYRTPIAQRPTAAQFETDPSLEYHPPPR